MLWVAFLIIALTGVCFYLKRHYSYFTNIGVKQTDPIWFFGDFLNFCLRKESFIEISLRIYNQATGLRYFGFYQFFKPILVIKDPELIKQIAIKDFDHFTDHQVFSSEDVDPIMGKNLLSLKGKRWRDMRTILSPSFTSNKMRIMYKLIKDVSADFVKYFQEQDKDSIEVEMKDTFTRFTNDVIATTAFGISVNSLENRDNEFYLMGKAATNFTGFSASLKFLLFSLSPKLIKYLKLTFLKKTVNDYFINIINDTLQQRREKNIVRPDVIHLLLETQKGNSKQEDDEQTDVDTGFATAKETLLDSRKDISKREITDMDIAAQATIFFFAGFESVSTLMCFTAYELSVNLDIQRKLREEINETYENHNGDITYEVLLKMKYLDMVISEVLRKWPSSILTDRLCTKPYTIQPASPEEKPVHLQKGESIWFSIVGSHRDPNHFPDPERFDPERFSEENRKKIQPYTYMPFGVGPRICIASRFALLETKTIFFNLLRHYEIVPSPKMILPLKIDKETITWNAVGGIQLCFNRLKNS